MHSGPWMVVGALVACVSSGAAVGGCFFHRAEDCALNPILDCFSSGAGSAAGGGGGSDGGTPLECVPTESTTPVATDCGVFVSNSGSDNADGTQTAPVKSLAKAIEMAMGAGKPVYACAEEFIGAVEVPAGVTIFGGLDCEGGWKYVGEKTKTTIRSEADEIALVLMGGEATTRIEDVRMIAADAMTEGGSSIAVLADGAEAELVRCELVAGNGAKGVDGADGDPNGAAAQAGVAGSAGKDACSDLDGMPGADTTLPGGVQVTNDCGQDQISIGGSGGEGNVPNGGGGEPGQMGSAGQAGVGEPLMGVWDCVPASGQGTSGSSGEAGAPGAGGAGFGTIAASGYTGTSGGEGTSGKPGQGGGGGGGAKGGMICAPGNMTGSGASGGSGGSGGCGGLPGQGGSAGGASIALVSVNASVTLTDCSLSSTKGGDGGAGGDAQGGGPGGLPGIGGQGAGVSNPACSGGQGGKGGNGGPGGGGLGGPSLGIAFTGTPPSIEGQTSVIPGTPGAGGPGGSANVAMNAGATGIAGEQQEFP